MGITQPITKRIVDSIIDHFDPIYITALAKSALRLHNNYTPEQFLFGGAPTLAGVIPDSIAGHDGGAVGGKASTFASAEVIDYAARITSGNVTELTKFFCFKTSSATTQTICGEWLETGNHRSWIATITSTGKLRIRISADGGDVNIKDYVTNDSVTGVFHRCGFSFDNGTLKVFIEGAEAAVTKTTDATVSSIYNSTSDFQIGSHTGGTDDFTGQISFLIGWSGTVLTAHEMAVLADSLELSSTNPSWLLYPIGDKCHDLTGNLSTVTGTETITTYSDPDVPIAKDFDLDSVGYRFAGGEYIPRRLNTNIACDGNALTETGRAKKPGQLEKGNAVVFGGSEVITVPNSVDFSGEDWTLSDHVIIDSLGATNQVILSQLDGTGTGQSWLYKNDADEWATAIGGTEQTFDNALLAGKVYEFELAKSGTTYTLTTINRTDDIAAVSDSVTATMQAADGAFKIGSDKAEANEITGKMFGIELDHVNGFHLPMCERSGVTFYDVSGNGKHGTGTATLTHTDTVNDVYHYPEAKGFSLGNRGRFTKSPVTGDVFRFRYKNKASNASFIFLNRENPSAFGLAISDGSGSSSSLTDTSVSVDGSPFTGTRDEAHTLLNDDVEHIVDITMGGTYNTWAYVEWGDYAGFMDIDDGYCYPTHINGVAINSADIDFENTTVQVPALADGTADAQSNAIQFPAGKYYNNRSEINPNPNGLYQFSDNLHQWAEFDGTLDANINADTNITGFPFSFEFDYFCDNSLYQYMITASPNTAQYFGPFQQAGSKLLSCQRRGGGVGPASVFSSLQIIEDAWNSIKVTLNSATSITFELNGVTETLTGLTSITFPIAATTDDLFIGQYRSSLGEDPDFRIKNLIVKQGDTIVNDMPLVKHCLDLSGNANHGTPTDVTFAKQTLDVHDFGDVEEIPTSINQATAGQETEAIIFSI